jgi:UDP-N-acetylmuramoyl-tripeptide--D-alanyl-D-alanine ligase
MMRIAAIVLVQELILASYASEVSLPSAPKAIGSAERETVAGTRLAAANCEASINEDDLQLGLKLGKQFLVNSQREGGNFRYEYDWLAQKESDDDNSVRQAGTLWGLSLLHVDDPKSGLLPTIRKALQYFDKYSKEFPGGKRLLIYPGQDTQKLGSVSLLALAHIEVLRRPEVLEPAEKKKYEAHLAGYLKAIVAARSGRDNFKKLYDGKTGKPYSSSSSYYDGESLLALTKAAKYLGHEEFWPLIKAAAEAGWKKHAAPGLEMLESKSTDGKGRHALIEKQDKEKLTAGMKGYYQWSTMSWYELTGTKDPDFAKYANRTMQFGNWLNQKNPGESRANLGYAFEGLIPAYITAVRQGNTKLEQELACTIKKGVENLHSLQVGHPKASSLAKSDRKKYEDKLAQGGAQGSRDSAALRIDTTQHQLHALLMAKRLLQKQAIV